MSNLRAGEGKMPSAGQKTTARSRHRRPRAEWPKSWSRHRFRLRPLPAGAGLEEARLLGGQRKARLAPGAQVRAKPRLFAGLGNVPQQLALRADTVLDQLRFVILEPLHQLF